MNTVVTSREAILRVSRELIQRQGWKAASIRAVAGACGICVGSVYRYFPSKADLMMATVESIWHDIFPFSHEEESFETLPACVEWVFDRLRRGDEKYPGFFTLHSMSLIGQEMESGKQRMRQSWAHMERMLSRALDSDPQVCPHAFDSGFSPAQFMDILFSLTIAALLRRQFDCSGILGLIRRTLYEQPCQANAKGEENIHAGHC